MGFTRAFGVVERFLPRRKHVPTDTRLISSQYSTSTGQYELLLMLGQNIRLPSTFSLSLPLPDRHCDQ